MTVNKQNAKDWVGKFLRGETSNAEEQALYEFFSTGDVPRDLIKYQAMFGWYQGGMKDPLPKGKQSHKARKITFTWLKIGIAAVLVIACGIGVKLFTLYQKMPDYSCYEGSYIIRNGEKITDLHTIMPILQQTLKEADAHEAQTEQMANKQITNPEKEIEQEILRNAPDEKSRKIISEILND